MTGLEIIRAPGTTAEQIADIIAEHCPPITPEHCDKLSCRECWHGWPPASPRRKRGRPASGRPPILEHLRENNYSGTSPLPSVTASMWS